MSIWAIGDLHLSFGVPDKKMDVFGKKWEDHAEKIALRWREVVQKEDLVLLPGDISWAKRLEEAIPDLQWIDQLPGTKVMIRGNHDYWWPSLKQLKSALPSSLHAIHNTVFKWKDVEVAGSRLWDSDFTFGEYIDYVPNERVKKEEHSEREARKIFEREVHRLEISLKEFSPSCTKRIVMTHYPPIDANLKGTVVSDLLEKYRVSVCVFGHLHNVKENSLPFGEKGGVHYMLASADYIDFKPLLIEQDTLR